MKCASTCWALGLVSLLCAGQAEGQGSGFTIAGVEAKLFYSNSGRFSANILANPKIVLHNTPIGEGTAEGPSESTLLLVKLAGPPKQDLQGLRLRITATTHADTLEDREIDVGPMNSAGKFYAACWLDDTGCEPITIAVQLTYDKEKQRKIAMIPFECSE